MNLVGQAIALVVSPNHYVETAKKLGIEPMSESELERWMLLFDPFVIPWIKYRIIIATDLEVARQLAMDCGWKIE